MRDRELRRALEGLFAGDRIERTLDLEDGLVAEVRIVVRRAVTADAQAEARAAALAELEAHPHRAASCSSETTRRSPFTRRYRDCSNRPNAAIVIPASDWARRTYSDSPAHYVRLVCGTHAARAEREGEVVVRLSRRSLADAPRSADQLDEQRWDDELAAERIGRALYAAARVGWPRDELAARRRGGAA